MSSSFLEDLSELNSMFPEFEIDPINYEILRLVNDKDQAKEIAKNYYLILQLIEPHNKKSYKEQLLEYFDYLSKPTTTSGTADAVVNPNLFTDIKTGLENMFKDYDFYSHIAPLEKKTDEQNVSTVAKLFEDLFITYLT